MVYVARRRAGAVLSLLYHGATAFGRCVGNTTRAATLDSMREVPT
jgi:hypothetical protein